MKARDYTTLITVNASPAEAFKCINNVTKWWTENLEGKSHELNDEFSVRFGDVHFSKQKLVDVIPGKKVTWLVTDSKLSFIKDEQEWTGTKIHFEISKKDNKTTIRFTHEGLIPVIECYGDCSNAWSEYIQGSLLNLVNTGKGQPTPEERKTKAVNK